MTCLIFTSALVTDVLTADGVHASESDSNTNTVNRPAKAGELYLPSDDSMADVTAVLDAARQSNRLALVIMGANWCHDSRALAERLNTEPLKTVASEYYETVFVDVGYLDKGKEVITSLGPPVYYATPTVLIVDPMNNQLVNAQNRHQWANAYNISMDESVEYFQLMANMDLTTVQGNDEVDLTLQELLTEIDAFEDVQANRLYEAYKVIGPMLKAYKEGDKDAFSEAHWNEVRDFRYKIPGDIDALRAEATKRVASGDNNIKLDYPEYVAFSWEKKGQ